MQETAFVLAFLVLLGWIAYRWIRPSALANVAGPPPPSFVTGNLLQVIDLAGGRDFLISMMNDYGGIVKVKTLLGRESLFVSDPKALHHMLVKEPYVFDEWSAFTATNSLLFGDGLVATIGDQHKKQRKMLNPVFSSKHLKGMTPTFFEIATKLENAIKSKVADKPYEIDMTRWLTRTALELIGQSGIGHSFDDFTEDGSSAFANAAIDLAATVSLMVPAAPFTPLFKKLGSPAFRRFIVESIPWRHMQRLREIVDIMTDNVQNIYREKKHDLQTGKAEHSGQDIMSILLKANNSSSAQDRLSEEELTGQMATLIFTATDTTSGAISRLLHLLSLHPHVQMKLREEIQAAFVASGGEALDFDTVHSLPYLDAVVKETLRVFPPIPMVFRQSTEDAVVPLLHPIRGVDGQLMSEVRVPRGTDIFISILGANHSKETWGPDASDWKPERWLAPLPESVTNNRSFAGVYSHMMTFIAGGRACIGFKFSQLEMKVVICTLLRSLEFACAKDKDIAWNMGLLMTPVVAGQESHNAHMPLLVKRLGA